MSLDHVAYEIRWYKSNLQMTPDSILLASIDRWGVVRKSPRNDTSDCSLERLGTQTFVLTIHGTQDSDAGEYYCTATPWTRSTTTEDWKKEPEIISEKIFLNVKFACKFHCVWFLPGITFVVTKSNSQVSAFLMEHVKIWTIHYTTTYICIWLFFSFSVGFYEIAIALWDMYIPHCGSHICHSGPSLFSVLLEKDQTLSAHSYEAHQLTGWLTCMKQTHVCLLTWAVTWLSNIPEITFLLKWPPTHSTMWQWSRWRYPSRKHIYGLFFDFHCDLQQEIQVTLDFLKIFILGMTTKIPGLTASVRF